MSATDTSPADPVLRSEFAAVVDAHAGATAAATRAARAVAAVVGRAARLAASLRRGPA